MNFQKLRWVSSVLILGVSAGSCKFLKKQDQLPKSKMLSLETAGNRPIAEGSNPKALCNYLSSNGYFPTNNVPVGTTVLFSTSYGVVQEAAGQGYGRVGSDGFLVQEGLVTTQLVLCPGARNISGGKCNWLFTGPQGYPQLAFDVVCNNKSDGTSQVHPGYNRQSAAQVTYRASTAGKSISGQNAVEVVLESGTSKARIIFAKGVGLVATMFQESTQPDGTAEVYIASEGGAANALGGLGNGRGNQQRGNDGMNDQNYNQQNNQGNQNSGFENSSGQSYENGSSGQTE